MAAASVGLVTGDPFLDVLVEQLTADPEVLGLVLAGSSAARVRRDEWSDHDFLVITTEGNAEQYRSDLSWLPDAGDIAFSFRETAHGLKALYRSGLLIEFAVADSGELATFALADYAIALDKGGVAELAGQVHARTGGRAPERVDPIFSFRMFLSLAYIGTGRARRGERLSANVFLRDYATSHLLRCAFAVLPADAAVLDPLDPWRRVEHALPGFAAAVDAALAQPVEHVGGALLDVATAHIEPTWPECPHADLVLVRALLGLSSDTHTMP